VQYFDLVVGKPLSLRRPAGTVPGSTIAQQPPLKSLSQSESKAQATGGLSDENGGFTNAPDDLTVLSQ
jgi:hypothetical protein